MFYKAKYEELYNEHSFALERISELTTENSKMMSHNFRLMEEIMRLKEMLKDSQLSLV